MKDRISEAINSTGLSNVEFARRMGKSKGVVTQWLDGTIKTLKADTAHRMQEVTGYRSDWLVFERGEKLVDALHPDASMQTVNRSHWAVHLFEKFGEEDDAGYLTDDELFGRLSDLTGIASKRVSDLRISCLAPTDEEVKKLEQAFKLQPGTIDASEPPMPDDPLANIPLRASTRVSKNDTGVVHIPHYDTGGAMGHGLVLRDQPGVIREMAVSKEWLQSNVKGFTSAENLCLVTGFGDSMRPLFMSGDPIIVDKGVQQFQGDGLYFFRVEGEGFIKRLQSIPGRGLVVISENPSYETWAIDAKTPDFQVLGKVVKAWKGEDY